MTTMAETILRHVEGQSEGRALYAKELLHLGTRAAVDQALARLVRRGRLMRVRRGAYLQPVETRFGTRAPAVSKVVEAIANVNGETIASHGAAAANALGLTTQVPVRTVYLTSGPTRQLALGTQTVELRHAPRWQLAFADRRAGEVLRALAWLGPSQAPAALQKLKEELPREDLNEILAVRPILPGWLAGSVSEIIANA